MIINIENCNNIEKGQIEISENMLNLKYAINGTGKTSIAKAIDYSINGKNLDLLKPFKYYDDTQILPSVSGIENINKVSIFNEEYVNTFLFVEDELIKNSFEVFVKTEEYESGIKEINQLLINLKETFEKDENINEFMNDLLTLSSCFGKSKGAYAASSSIGKGLANGNRVENIPQELSDYAKYIKNEKNVKWLKWQLEGKEFLDIDSKCPYCTSMEIEKNKEKINKLEENYDANVIGHLNKVLEVFSKLDIYFSDDMKKKIYELTTNIGGIKEEQKTLLIHTKDEIDVLYKKLFSLKTIGFISLKDSDKVTEIIKEYIIDKDAFLVLKSDIFNNKVDEINQKISEILGKADSLQEKIQKQNLYIQKIAEKYNTEINDFLKSAGIKYNVRLELDGERYKLKFRHNDCENKIDSPPNFLSYGERNAFALILFMYQTLKEKPELIILDDPISSFDKNKKYAIINMLFNDKFDSFKGKTVVMLTHDFEPIIDMKYVLSNMFNAKAFFLENKNGIVSEKEITRNDIQTITKISEENIKSCSNDIIKLIHLRRLYEIENDKKEAYDVVSSLFHKREIPTDRNKVELPKETIEKGEESIRKYVSTFDYKETLKDICDDEKMKVLYLNAKSNYEKIQIFRVLYDGVDFKDNVLRKFVNESFHIENDYLFQLDPYKYEIIPNYVIELCNIIILDEKI